MPAMLSAYTHLSLLDAGLVAEHYFYKSPCFPFVIWRDISSYHMSAITDFTQILVEGMYRASWHCPIDRIKSSFTLHQSMALLPFLQLLQAMLLLTGSLQVCIHCLKLSW